MKRTQFSLGDFFNDLYLQLEINKDRSLLDFLLLSMVNGLYILFIVTVAFAVMALVFGLCYVLIQQSTWLGGLAITLFITLLIGIGATSDQ